MLSYNDSRFDNQPFAFNEEKDLLFKLDNTLQNNIFVPVENTNVSLAYTDRKNIFLNFKQLGEKFEDDYFSFLVALKGLNYHELCHILYTKYSNTPGYIANALNILEDQRIENIFSKKYKKAGYYFKVLHYSFILNQKNFKQFGGNSLLIFSKELGAMTYVLLYGRRFIIANQKIMDTLRLVFANAYGVNKTNELEAIIDEYLITTKVQRQKELAKQLTELLDEYKLPNPLQNMDGYGVADRSRVGNEEKQELKKIKIELSQEKEQQSSGDSNSKGTQENEQQSSGDSNSKGTQEKDKPSPKISDAEKEAEKELEGVKRELKKEINKAMEKMDKRDFRIPTPVDGQLVDFEPYLRFSPDVKHYNTAKILARQIKKIKTDLDNKHIYKQKKGVVSTRHAMLNQGHKLNDFKRYIPSRLSKTKLNISLLLDSSGSMDDRNFDVVISSAWSISKALEQTGNSVEVVEFSEDYRIMKPRERDFSAAKWGRAFQTGTSPLEALKEIHNGFKKTKKFSENKLLLFFTDGGYSDEHEVHEKITNMRKDGVIVIWMECSSYIARRYMAKKRDAIAQTVFNQHIRLNNFTQVKQKMPKIITELQSQVVRKVAV